MAFALVAFALVAFALVAFGLWRSRLWHLNVCLAMPCTTLAFHKSKLFDSRFHVESFQNLTRKYVSKLRCGPVAFPLLAFAPVAFELASVLLLALGAKFDHMVPCQREILQSFLSCSCGCYSIYATKYGRGFWRLRPVCVRDA